MKIFGNEFTLEALKAIQTPSLEDEIENIRDTLNDEKKPIFDAALSGRNIFVTGEGGCGKSYLIKSIVEAMQKQRALGGKAYKGSIIVAGSTGKAALNVNGMTINRVLGIGCDLALTKNRKNHTIKAAKLKKCRAIIVDEVSMVRVDILDSLFLAVKKINDERANETDRRKKRPPIAVHLYGDFHQLPPVYGKNSVGEDEMEILRKFYATKHDGWDIGDGYAFESYYWEHFGFEYFMLKECMRNKHQRQKNILSCMRKGCNAWNVLEELNMTCSQEPYEGAVTIYPYLKDAARKNKEELDKLDTPLVQFPPIFEGDASEEVRQETPTLELKLGAQVIMTSNAYENAPYIINPESNKCYTKDLYVNGTVAKVVDLVRDEEHPDNDEIWLETEYDGIVKSWPVTFGIKRHSEPIIEIWNGYPKIVGETKIFNIVLGYSVSVHKSQGMSLDRVNIGNIGSGDFANGLAYVAFSRCTSLEGIGLDGWVMPGDIKVSQKVVDWEREKFGEKADVNFTIGPMTDEYGTVGENGYQGFGHFSFSENDVYEISELNRLEIENGNIEEYEEVTKQEEIESEEDCTGIFTIIEEIDL